MLLTITFFLAAAEAIVIVSLLMMQARLLRRMTNVETGLLELNGWFREWCETMQRVYVPPMADNDYEQH